VHANVEVVEGNAVMTYGIDDPEIDVPPFVSLAAIVYVPTAVVVAENVKDIDDTSVLDGVVTVAVVVNMKSVNSAFTPAGCIVIVQTIACG